MDALAAVWRFVRRRGDRVLSIHNPFKSRVSYGCRLRLAVNTYVGCYNRCLYCYTYSYTRKEFILNPRIKKNFKGRLDRDIREYCGLGLPKIPVYLSSNCEPFQPLEEEHRHSLYALQRLTEAEFPIILMTKNPAKLLEPEYVSSIDRSRTIIQVTVPFLDSRFEPRAPLPRDRIEAMRRLSELGFMVVARIDPVIPVYGGVAGQSKEEILELVEMLSRCGVKLIISKCLKLARGIAKVYREFYYALKPYYRRNCMPNNPEMLNLETRRMLLTPIYEAANKYGVKLATCTDHAAFPETIPCDGSEESLKNPPRNALMSPIPNGH